MKTIAIDFDAVIHQYSKGWQDGSVYDEEVNGVFVAIALLFEQGYSVVVFSTRKPKQIERWLKEKCYYIDWVHVWGDDPKEYTYPKFGFEVEIIPWWRVIFSKNFFWNKAKVLGITNIKIPAHIYIDDRALKFEGDWEKTLDDIKSFKTYQNK